MYHIFLVGYALGIRIAALWNPKARLWLAGRKNLFSSINLPTAQAGCQLPTASSQVIWMHCASLGEFEQGRPLLEDIKLQYPGYRIVLSFFSPSGYEVMKDYPGADHIFYLPMDSLSNAKKFIDAVKPSLVLWVKYEYWFYYLDELKRRNIPVILVSGIFRAGQPFFKWYGGIWRAMLGCFTHFFVQNEASEKLLQTIGIKENITLNGDTRFDRVIAIAKNFEPVPHIEGFCDNNRVIVAGSTWEEDEIELLHYVKVHPEIKFIIAPHEVGEKKLNEVKKEFPNSVFYSSLAANPAAADINKNVLIIDNIGMLSRLYKYATITYVGGGFGSDGVHNVLEAAVFGKPVVFGPEYEKFAEATGLVEAGGGLSFSLPLGLEKIFTELLSDESSLKEAGDASKEFVFEQQGATGKIISYIQEKRLLTN